ncbi:class I SAM-dependent methyltransferase [Halopiger xanaduensis]|uniref:Uncharacterized protein n=1 Tax=Halopiger xanaduensis (strain DSM 18323 / JCM 14033 / SH-6) TaxID=797210 RepID=F8D3S6_HALXS|nr:class I SAM-dependent methyltransferase [Halopiger xanaduensis]AEH38579.1 hypothetical protein Halxa_3974 [Halopiger xanaduensis SH-6]
MTDDIDLESTYERRLDERIRTIAGTTAATIRDVIRGSQGAFPTVVYDRLEALGLAESLREGRRNPVARPGSLCNREPELHPLDFEWYFTAETTTAIATTVAESAAGPVLCLGAPTVAFTLAERGVPVTLVDRNELIETRFAPRYDTLTFANRDIGERLALEETHSVAFFDPPWYPDDTAAWLHRAATNVAQGGRIYFVLFPPLVRPAARAQRERLLATAEQLGSVAVDDGAITYRTPPFEREVLREEAVPVVRDWRRGDLVRIDGVSLSPDALSDPPSTSSGPAWETFVADGRVVKVRQETASDAGAVLSPVEGCDGYLLPSVSRRDARRRNVDLWTSRNRVASVGDREAVAEALRRLETGADLTALRSTSFEASISDRERDRLVDRLRTILA